MKIQKGIVKYKDRNDIVCTYAVTDDGKQYFFLDENGEKRFSNGSRISSTELVEAIDPMVKASHIGIIDNIGREVIPFVNKSIRPINDSVVLVELSEPVSQSVIDAVNLKSDPLSATKLVSTPAAIKEKINSKMGNDGRYLFNDQFSEVTVCDINGNNLINNEYYSFVGVNSDKLYFSKNTVDSEVYEYLITADGIVPVNNSEIDVVSAQVPVDTVENVFNSVNNIQDSNSLNTNALSNNDFSIPAVPGIAVDNVPEVPSVAADTVPEVPSVAADTVPEVPGVAADTVPEVPSVAADTVPEVPSVAADTVPEVPSVAADTIPEVPSVAADTIPEVPSVAADTVPEVPSVAADTIPEVPSVAADIVPEVPSVAADTIPEVPSVAADTIPEVPSIAADTVPEVPSVAADTVPEVPSVNLEGVNAVTGDVLVAPDSSQVTSGSMFEYPADVYGMSDVSVDNNINNEVITQDKTEETEKKHIIDIPEAVDNVTIPSVDSVSSDELDNSDIKEDTINEEEMTLNIDTDSSSVGSSDISYDSELNINFGQSEDNNADENDAVSDSAVNNEVFDSSLNEEKNDKLIIGNDIIDNEIIGDDIEESVEPVHEVIPDEIETVEDDLIDTADFDSDTTFDDMVKEIPVKSKYSSKTSKHDYNDIDLIDDYSERTLKNDFRNGDDYMDNIDNDLFESDIKRTSSSNESIMADVAKSLSSLMKQNRNQKNTISEYQEKLNKVSASRRNVIEKNKAQEQKIEMQEQRLGIQEQRIEVLNSKNKSCEATISNLESKLKALESKLREQDKLIANQSQELEVLRPQKDDLAKLIADAQALLSDDDSSESVY